MNFVSMIENFFNELRRNEIDAFAVADDKISRHDRDPANPHRDVDSGQHDIADRSRVGGAEVGRHIDLREAIEIADAAVDNEAATLGGFHHVIEEVVAYDGAVDFLAEEIDDKDVSRLQHVDGELIAKARQASIFGLGLSDAFHIGAPRHELHGEGASDHGFSGMKNLKAVGVLIVVTLFIERGPHFFGGESAGALDHGVGNLRASVEIGR